MIAVFSDVHGNSGALRSTLAKMNGHEARLCLGDVVGYRRRPEEAVCLVRANSDVALQGNHDAAAVGALDEFLVGVPDWLRQTLLDVELLPDELWEWLAALRPHALWGEYELFHGSLQDPLMGFLVPQTAAPHFASQQTRISFVGHTHRALALGSGGVVWEPSPENPTLDLACAERWALNPGYLGARAGGTWLETDGNIARWYWV